MSWDVYVKQVKEVETEVGGMTWNVGKMYYEALGIPFRELNNMKAKDAKLLLQKAVLDMKSNIEKYDAMNPANGWGSRETALGLLEKLLVVCNEDDEGIVCIY